ncbi:TetR family transcriptional regulator [Micromonospora chersina]|uniref:TetR family transcriptional regulator n=1 Tax=Micromonospora chersina TaxID=47854 RepID=UPI0037215BAE
MADADGLEGLTMQRVAESLDVTKMALYRYVPGRAELVALMLEAAVGEPPAPPPGADWRGRLDGVEALVATRAAAGPRHPGGVDEPGPDGREE